MKFVLIDHIKELVSGQRLTAVKSVSLAEEYLGDHFPVFPVLPGVLLLEGLIESATWLVREKQDFANSMVLLESVKNVKYKSFAAPGMQIEYAVTAQTINENTRLTLRHFNLETENPKLAHIDGQINEAMKNRFKLLYKG